MRSIQSTVYVAEDGYQFLDENEARTHEAVLYINATIDAFGPKEVMIAVQQVQTADPAFMAGIQGVASILQRRHAVIPDNLSVKVIKSVNAPDNVRSADVLVDKTEKSPLTQRLASGAATDKIPQDTSQGSTDIDKPIVAGDKSPAPDDGDTGFATGAGQAMVASGLLAPREGTSRQDQKTVQMLSSQQGSDAPVVSVGPD